MPVHPRQTERPTWQQPFTPAELRAPLTTPFADPDAAPEYEQTADGLARAMRDQFPNCDEASLQAAGFTLAFQSKHGDKARAIANAGFSRQLDSEDERGFRIERAANMAAGLVAHDAIVTHLLGNGFRPRELGDIMPEVIARMCEIVVGKANTPAQVQ